MSDPFEELEKGEEKEESFDDLYENFKLFLKDQFVRFDLKNFEWTDPVTKIHIKYDGDKVSFDLNGKDPKDILNQNIFWWNLFVKDCELMLTWIVSKQKVNKRKRVK